MLPIAESNDAAADPAAVGLMMAIAAMRRKESRGAHYRTDFPHPAPDARRSEITLEAALGAARELAHSSAVERATR
ncbi:msl6271 [Mesorhizobium japonicum MAFF 303099]|uniref:Msl6271 protein n=2 Tax=Mesorhizobium japonicum TaxID=2066070 RepID=Q989V0_RHILO|nr:msl6271 [Mesorhizobium japonicum MAFF 303099]